MTCVAPVKCSLVCVTLLLEFHVRVGVERGLRRRRLPRRIVVRLRHDGRPMLRKAQ